MEQQRPERAHYRIQYPVNERPRLIVAGREYEVLNCSEKGVCFLAPGTHRFVLDGAVQGVIRFSRGHEAEVDGRVVRIEGALVALHLAVQPIPFRIVLDEQRFLRQKYPMWPREV